MKKVVGYPLPLGISEKNGVVNFAIAVESGKKCNLCIFNKGEEVPAFEVELCEEDAIGEVRFVAFPTKEVEGKEYCYKVDEAEILDVYARSISKNNRGVISFKSYDWEGDKPLRIPYHEVIAYNLHVRGFSKHSSSQVDKKGTFAGIVEKIPYMQELGINQIQCMPVYAFKDNAKYTNYWGYGEAAWFAIKDLYADGGCPAKELKDMVKACHKAGIEVVLNLPFTDKAPKQLILECLQYYVMEFHVDGFILNGYNAPMEQICGDPILKHTKILQNKDDFQNVMRRFLKGDEDMVSSAIGWLSKGTAETGSCNYITNHTGFTLADLVSYNEKHNEANGEENKDGPTDNFSWNCGEEGPSRKKQVLELRKKQLRNAMFLLLMAQGTPSILAGDEFLNSQGGNNNVYCQDNETAWLDWKKLEKENEFLEYVKKLIELRKNYPIMHTDRCLNSSERSYHGESAWRPVTDQYSRQFGVCYHDVDGADVYIAYNMHYSAQKLALPTLGEKKQWHLVLSTAADVEEDVVCERQIMVSPRTILMFVGR